MSAKTKIKADWVGLFVVADGWIARPFWGTIFKAGDEVKSHHFGGSTNAGVTNLKGNFRSREHDYELWCTTGILYQEFVAKVPLYQEKEKPWDEYFKEKYDWYKNYSKGHVHCKLHNEDYAKKHIKKINK